MTALETFALELAGGEPVSDDVRELVELHFIDTIGAWIASMGSVEGLLLLKFRAAMRETAKTDNALDLSTRCALARASEIDDIHLASMTTPGGIVIPAALTLAATRPAITADELAAAIVVGYEAMTRLGRAIDGPSVLYRGIWPTYFAAPFAVAAVAARILKLDATQTAHALALALTLSAAGVGQHLGETTARWFAIGEAATKGLTSARAAQQGFTSDLDLLADNFLPQIFGISPQIEALTDGLSKQSTLTEVSFKPWCAARQTMAATQALLEIIESGIPPQSIDSIRAFVLPPHRRMIDHGVKEGDRASHLTSVQYQMAVAALGEQPTGALAPEHVQHGRLTSPRNPGLPGLRSMLRKSGKPDLRWGEVGMCAPRAHIPGEGVLDPHDGTPHPDRAQARDPTSPSGRGARPLDDSTSSKSALVQAFMKKITVEPDETLLKAYPRSWPARVAVTAGSARYERTVTDIPGDPARPFDRARVREKFMRFVAPVTGKESADRILDACTDAFAGGSFASLLEAIERVGTEKLASAKAS